MALVHVQRSPTPSSSSSPCVSESGSGEDNRRSQTRSISESFLTVKGAALFLPRGNGSSPSSESRISQRSKHTGDLQQHLQIMFTVLRPEDNIRLAVRLESAYPHSTRYMVVVSTNGRQDTEESVVLGVDFASSDCSCSVGLVLPLWSDTLIHLDGDGGFSVSTVNRVHVFKPVSVQAMWSALQSLHKACEVARCHNYYPGSLFLTWVSYYQSRVTSDQLCINEWNAMQDVQSHRADSPVLFTDVPTERERTERLIKTRLREIMMQKDLENVTSKEIRTELEMQMVCNLREFKEFIDNEMIVILGQMDSPTEIFDHLFLGSEWNASNLEELQNSGVRYILNVTREIDNFFPGLFEYHNIRVYDEEATNLLEYWNDTFKFISKAKKAGVKCLVHCKMGVSRSASTVIAYAMKEYGWDLDTAFDYVKERRAVTKPNPSFMRQLEEYQGILLASKQRHNKLWRSRSDSDLSERHQQFCKPAPDTLSHSHPQNNNNNSPPPSLHHFLGAAVLQALRADPQDSSSPPSDTPSDAAERTGSRARASPPPVSNGHSALQGRGRSQDPVLPPRPRPRAATVVPEERRDTASLKATLALPLVTPHPPQVLHILPPSAQTPPPRGPPSPSPLPEQGIPLALSLDLPDLSSSETSSEADTPGDSLSELVSERLDSHDSVPMAVSPLSPTATPLEGPFPTDDPNNNNPTDPSWGRPGGGLDSPTDRSSSLSTDSIDFVSAREKFLGLSQEDRTRSLSEQGPQRTPPPSEEPGPDEAPQQEKISPLAEDRVDRSILDKSSHLHFNHNHPPDNGVSVRHIVTEIESISHPPPRSPQQPRADHGEEDQETGEVTRGSLTPPSYPQSPSTPPPDWPVGSVRRVTKQLEQRLRQELDTPSLPAQRSPEQPPSRSPLCSVGSDLRSPLPSPGAEAPPPARSPLPFPMVPAHTPNTDCPPRLHAPGPNVLFPYPSQPTLSISSAAPHGSQPTPSQPSPRDVEESNTDSKRGVNSFSDMDTLPDPHPDPSPIIIIQPSLDPCPEPLASPGPLLWLDGVTLLDSETEPAPPCDALARLAPSSQELERIQETLRELQAFLYEAGGQTGAPDTPESLEHDLVQAERARRMGPEAEREMCQGAGPRRPPRETPVWQRAMEIEARIRQAGLTPPSLMKRSASLAKLDCLELSTNDLNDWELCPAPYLASSSAAPQDPPSPAHPSPDDVWKKQRVLSQSPPSPRGQTLRAGAGLQLQGAFPHPPLPLPDSSQPSPPPRPPQQGEGGGEEGSPDPSQTSRSVQAPAVMSGRQQGRGHPLRRLRKAADKKRTNTVLYNTM